MKQNDDTRRKIYNILDNFITLAKQEEHKKLIENFQMSQGQLEELYEFLKNYYDNLELLCIPPYEVAFIDSDLSRIPIEIDGEEDEDIWSLECALWVDDKEGEAILHADLHIDEESINFDYRYIGS